MTNYLPKEPCVICRALVAPTAQNTFHVGSRLVHACPPHLDLYNKLALTLGPRKLPGIPRLSKTPAPATYLV